MPVVGDNVLQNPDWSELSDDGMPLYWTTDATWDPMLAYGCGGGELFESFGTDGGLEVLAANSLRVDWGRSTQLDPPDYGGLLYAGDGFDGVPGDTWRIRFTATRRSFPTNFTSPGFSLGPTLDLLVRVGRIESDGAGGFTSYTMSLPAYAMARSAGTTIMYDEEFEIPSDWPEGIYQFAVVTTGSSILPFNSVYTWGMRNDFSDFALELVSNGSGSPGPAGVASAFVNWPVPRWAPGWPTCDPPLCCGMQEWDQFELRDPLTADLATTSSLPHTGAPTGPTTVGRYTTLFWEQEFDLIDSWHFHNAGGGDAGGDCGLLPDGDPNGTEYAWASCGEFCSFLAFYATVVPVREYQFSSLGGGLWLATWEFRPLLVHPTSLGGRVNGLGRETAPWTPPVPLPDDPDAIFCWSSCSIGPGDLPAPQPVYLTHEVAPGDPNIAAGGSGGLNLRGLRVSPGAGEVDVDAGGVSPMGAGVVGGAGGGGLAAGGSGSGGISLSGVKGQPSP